MDNTFYGTKLVTTCPANMVQYVTNWEGSTTWNGKISCVCADGYHMDTGTCVGNTITITWNGASQADIDANNAGSAVYGGNINTPRAATPIPGKRFTGWTFEKPVQSGE